MDGWDEQKAVPEHVALSLLQNHPFSPFSVWVGFHYPLCNTYRGRLLDIGNQVNGQQQSFPESQQTITVVTWLHTSYWMEKWYWQINWHLLLAGLWIAISSLWFITCKIIRDKSESDPWMKAQWSVEKNIARYWIENKWCVRGRWSVF